MISISTLCELPLLTWFVGKHVINSQIHFDSFDSDSKSSSAPPLQKSAMSPHTSLMFVSHGLSRLLRYLRNCYISKSEYFVKTFNLQNVWWLCVFWPVSWEPKNIKGLFLRCLQKVTKKMQPIVNRLELTLPTAASEQPDRLKNLSAKCAQTLPFRADFLLLWTVTVPFLQSLLHSSTSSPWNANQ